MKCLLTERLYVPESVVPLEALEDFEYSFDDRQMVKDSRGFSREVIVPRQVSTWKSVKGNDGKLYYGFARGNLEKLKKHFGHLEWVDKTAAPKMTSGLKFKETFRLQNWKDDERGQIEAVTDWLKYKQGILRAAPRFGKTISSIYILTALGLKTVIIAHQEDLLHQFYEEFLECTNLEALLKADPPSKKRRDATGHIVGLFNDFKNPAELDVTLVTYQTFASKFGPKRLKEHRNTWGFTVVDECHSSGAFGYSGVLNELNSKHRLGLSGTVERVDGKEAITFDIIGPVVAKGICKEVIAKVCTIHTGVSVPFNKWEKLVHLQKRLAKDGERLALVLKFLKKDVADGRYICVGFHGCSQVQLVQFTEMLQDYGIKAGHFFGETENRAEALKEFKTGDVQVAVCNMRMLTGINVPRWDCYYVFSPTSNVKVTKTETGKELGGNFPQQFKRVLTPHKYPDGRKKEFAIIRDFVDDLPFCASMYKKRLQAYKYQKYLVHEINFKKVKKVKDDL